MSYKLCNEFPCGLCKDCVDREKLQSENSALKKVVQWQKLTIEKREQAIAEACEIIGKGDFPLRFYQERGKVFLKKWGGTK